MEIVNETPFPCDFMLSKHEVMGLRLSVIVKATFEVSSNKTITEAGEQIPIAISDEYRLDDQGPIILLVESDMAPFKPRTDIILIGKAYAPSRGKVKSIVITLKVGSLKRSILVFGDRQWYYPSKLLPPSITEPLSFTEMELTYEKAYGGRDEITGEIFQANPVGRGFTSGTSKKSLHGKILPNFEDPDNIISKWSDSPKPVGFGFIDKSWYPRFQFAGAFDKQWEVRGGLGLPTGLQFDFYNGAHQDLQVKEYLRGDEKVEMTNLTPDSRLEFNLPGVKPVITISKIIYRHDFIDNTETESTKKIFFENNVESTDIQNLPTRKEDLYPHLDTLVFFPDKKIFYQVWRGVYPIKDYSMEEIREIRVQAAHL